MAASADAKEFSSLANWNILNIFHSTAATYMPYTLGVVSLAAVFVFILPLL